MAHLSRNSGKLATRVRRIAGQVAALERSFDAGVECAQALVQIAAIRGAVNGLLMQVLSEHLLEHVAHEPDADRRVDELAAITGLLRTYVK